jgi:RNA-binding protein 23/39
MASNTLAPARANQKREQNNRVYVGGLTGALSSLTRQEIAAFFEPFGCLENVDLPKDSQGRNKGHAIIEYATHKDAKIASQSMNGFEVADGQKLKVNILTDGPTIATN